MGLILFKLLYGYGNLWQYMSYDEAYNVHYAVNCNFRSDGLFYRLYLMLLNIFINNPLSLYRTNFALITIIYGFSFYTFSLIVTKSTGLAFLFASVFLIANSTFSMSPSYIAHFNSFLLMFLLILSWEKKLEEKIIIFLLGTFIVTYVRPEFFISFIIFALYSALFAVGKFYKSGNLSSKLLFFPFILVLILFNFNPAEGNRSMDAFCQHYAYGQYKLGMWPEDPWSYCGLVLEKDFGKVDSLLEVAFSNPYNFISHLGRNIYFFSFEFHDMVAPFFLKKNELLNSFFRIEILLFFLIIGYWFLQLFIEIIKGRINSNNFFFFLLILPVFLSILVIYPRPHYLLMVFPLMLVLGTGEIIKKIKKISSIRFLILPHLLFFGLIVLLLYITPWRFGQKIGFLLPDTKAGIHNRGNCTSNDWIAFLNKLDFGNNRIFFLSSLGLIPTFLPEGWSSNHHFDKTESFNLFKKKFKTNLIWVNSNLINDLNFRNDSEFNRLLINPISNGWSKIIIPNCPNDYLLYKYKE